MSRVRLARIGLVVGLVATQLILLAPSVSAREAIILRTSKPGGNPGLLDTTIQNVVYDADAGTIAVTAIVACYSDTASLIFVDFSASQVRGGTTRTATAFNDRLDCGVPFTELLATADGFVPGRATVEVDAFVCSLNCANETMRAEVVLIP